MGGNPTPKTNEKITAEGQARGSRTKIPRKETPSRNDLPRKTEESNGSTKIIHTSQEFLATNLTAKRALVFF